ncbi:MAG: MmcQ/YjbR family DNA-binding protein [Ruminococcus sp.]|nr:MmcQ/YjbR family DNA-binding protein [Ruminococcus sp.]
MLNISGIFKNKTPNFKRLAKFGFTELDACFTYSKKLDGTEFDIIVKVSKDGEIQVRVTDSETGEEYVLVHLPDVSGGFVTGVILACEDVLQEIADSCFDTDVFKFPQTRRVLEYAKEKYKMFPEFLWEKFDDNAILRRQDTKKWIAVLLTVSRRKLGLDSDEIAEVIDLRGEPQEIERLIDNSLYFGGYHMNKKHWYTICLDETVPDEELFERIDKSFELAKKK